ncbi:MAG: orotidine-5'-phosphate decarboxylase [Armatimonadetes bacterium]|nr:orotidine-5'-phosphate decarboxylase [Armatimonadota bacterium]
MEATAIEPQQRIIVALDCDNGVEALGMAERLSGHVGAVKVGLELFNAGGPQTLRRFVETGTRVFYDAKLHDIPVTVARAVAVAARTGVWMINLHATGGSAMMQQAEAANAELQAPPLLIGVTLLTSLDERALADDLRVSLSPLHYVVHLAKLAQAAGLHGVVASPREAAAVREACGSGFLIVTPGVRPTWAAADDQKRIATPAEAVADGADYLVIGRPITRASDPLAAAMRVAEELA